MRPCGCPGENGPRLDAGTRAKGAGACAARSLSRQEAQARCRRIVHRRFAGGDSNGYPRFVRCLRARLHHLQQRGKGGDARRPLGDASKPWGREPRDRRSHGQGVLAHAPVDLAVSITGIAGPGGAVPGKPVGLVHLAAASRAGRLIQQERKYGDVGRAQVRRACVIEALAMLGELAAAEQAKFPTLSA